jgi:hypothetical protein
MRIQPDGPSSTTFARSRSDDRPGKIDSGSNVIKFGRSANRYLNTAQRRAAKRHGPAVRASGPWGCSAQGPLHPGTASLSPAAPPGDAVMKAPDRNKCSYVKTRNEDYVEKSAARRFSRQAASTAASTAAPAIISTSCAGRHDQFKMAVRTFDWPGARAEIYWQPQARTFRPFPGQSFAQA